MESNTAVHVTDNVSRSTGRDKMTHHQSVWGPPSTAMRVSGCAAMSRVAMSKELVKEKIELLELIPCSTRRVSSDSGTNPSPVRAWVVNSPLVNHLTSLRRGILYNVRGRRRRSRMFRVCKYIDIIISIVETP